MHAARNGSRPDAFPSRLLFRFEEQKVLAAIFDMDGLLIDSEPLWQEAEIAVFGALGLNLTREQCLETRGRRTREIVAYWYAKRPWPTASIDEVRARLIDAVTQDSLEVLDRYLDGDVLVFALGSNIATART